MAKRKGIPKGIRFEVFKRDAFTCQYCGKKAPDVILVIDHIKPVSKGGDGDIMNLVTACEDCNSGKSDKLLSDKSAIERQRTQVELLQIKREQIDMMLSWRESLLQLNDYEVDKIMDFIDNRIKPYSLNRDVCAQKIKEYNKRWGISEVLSGVEIASNQYLKIGVDGINRESIDVMLEKLPGICNNRKKYADNPDLHIIDSIRFFDLRDQYINVPVFYSITKKLLSAGFTAQEIKDASANCKSWTNWKNKMDQLGSENNG